MLRFDRNSIRFLIFRNCCVSRKCVYVMCVRVCACTCVRESDLFSPPYPSLPLTLLTFFCSLSLFMLVIWSYPLQCIKTPPIFPRHLLNLLQISLTTLINRKVYSNTLSCIYNSLSTFQFRLIFCLVFTMTSISALSIFAYAPVTFPNTTWIYYKSLRRPSLTKKYTLTLYHVFTNHWALFSFL